MLIMQRNQAIVLGTGGAILLIIAIVALVLRTAPPPPIPPPVSSPGPADGSAVTPTSTAPDEFERSLQQGTVLRVSADVDIGLISVFDGIAALSVRDAGNDPTVRTLKVGPGDAFEVTGYAVTVLDVKELPNFSLAPGSGKDYVVFKFQKK